MRVANLKIENFRGIRDGFVRFKKHPVLVGGNNAGKTTLIEALTLLLGRDRLIRDLTEHDFYGSNPQPIDRIGLVATITDFPGDDPDESGDWFRDGRAIPKWLDEAADVVHPLRSNPEWRLCCQIAVQAYFDRDSLTVETVRYFYDHDHPIDPFAEDAPVGVPSKLIQQLGFYLVRASRTWDRALSWGSELFRRTIYAAAAQPSTAILAERDRLRAPTHPIEQDAQISALIHNIDSEIARCIPNAPTLQLRITSTDSRSVMEAVSAHFVFAGGPSIPAARQGSGLVSLQGLMLLLELGRIRASAGEGFLMALEEPELHLPPATQQQLVQRVQSLSTQTLITTHSPVIAAMADPTSVMILRNDNGQLTAEPLLIDPLLPDAPNWKRKLFQHNRVDVLSALMHPVILIPEGRSDFHLLKAILRPLMLTEGWISSMPRAFSLEVGVVPTEDAKVVETHVLLSRVHQQICCLVDGDAPGQGYMEQLLAVQPTPAAIVRWHDEAMIEDVVGWILMADEAAAMPLLGQLANQPPQTSAEVVMWLKANKVDIVSYETVADAIANTLPCRARAAELFSGLASACVFHANWTGIPRQTGHAFHMKLDSRSAATRG